MPLSLRRHLIRGASGSLVLIIISTALGLILAVVLARILGVRNFGIYAFCLSIAHILSIPAMLGGQQLLVREVAACKARGDFHLLRGLFLFFRRASVSASFVLALAAAGIGLAVYRNSPMLVPFMVAAALVPLQSAVELQGAALRGLGHVMLGQAAQCLRPVLVITTVGCIFQITGQKLAAESALSAQLAASAVLVVLYFLLLRSLLPQQVKRIKPAYELSRWRNSMLPFVFAGGMQILNREIAVVLLGALQSAEAVGLYRVAQRGAELVPFGLLAVNMAIAPTVSELFARGEKERLQRLVSKSIVAVLAFAVPVFLGLVFGGRWLIPLVFGEDFAPAYTPLVILCVGQLINAGMGSVGVILNMAGLERFAARGVVIAAVTGIVLSFVLIPFFGAVGAAGATSISLFIWNVLLFRWLYRETGIVSTFVPGFWKLKETA